MKVPAIGSDQTREAGNLIVIGMLAGFLLLIPVLFLFSTLNAFYNLRTWAEVMMVFFAGLTSLLVILVGLSAAGLGLVRALALHSQQAGLFTREVYIAAAILAILLDLMMVLVGIALIASGGF